MLQFALNSYVSELRALGHKDVPTNAELSKLLDIAATSFSRIAQNRQDGPSRAQLETIIKEFRRRGFNTTPNDLLRWIDGVTIIPEPASARALASFGNVKESE